MFGFFAAMTAIEAFDIALGGVIATLAARVTDAAIDKFTSDDSTDDED
jgi:hypothetical protein